MELQTFILLLTSLVCCSAQVLDPRGPRPVEAGYKADKCATQKEWGFCSDDDWGSKCPSGCKILGLMEKHDHEMLKKISRIRTLLEKNQAQHSSTDRITKQTYEYLKEGLTTTAGGDNSYYDMSQKLRRHIVDMKIKIDRQLILMSTMKEQIKGQVDEMQRMEVDVDMKLRACKGSCKTYAEFSVDQASYVTLDKQMAQLDTDASQSVAPSRPLSVMKSRQLKELTAVDSRYKSGSEQSDVTFFPEVQTMKLILETEGSLTSPATVSKVPGTSSSTSTSTSSSSFPGTGSKGITEMSGPGTDMFTSSSSSCTKSIRTVVTQTASGPVETREEVIEGGPGCRTILESSRGGMGTFFPNLAGPGSSSSSSHSFTSNAGGAKGSLLDTKTGFADFGFDLGTFGMGNVEEDFPDVHARSIKSSTIVQSDNVGKDCADILKHHTRGKASGLFEVNLGQGQDTRVVEVYCDQSGFMGGWLLVQQRETGQQNFNRSWAEYRQGFGSVDAQGRGEMWLGNHNLHLLTNRSESMLRVELEDWEGGVAMAQYSVRVGSEEEGFRLEVSHYEGEAGDALGGAGPLLSHTGMRFSTADRDQDSWGEGSCAELYGGGWWYNNCLAANLNGVYYRGKYDPESNSPYEVENGVVWTPYKPADYSLKRVRMSIRPAAF